MWSGSVEYKNASQLISFCNNSGRPMTAIVWQYTPLGFSIGADGRRRGADGAIESETMQKVHSVQVLGQGIVYAWSGTTSAVRADGIPVDLKFLTDCALETIDVPSSVSFSDFMKILANNIHTLFVAYIGAAAKSYKLDEIARATFFAYFKGLPYVGEIILKHSGTTILKPETLCFSPPSKFRVFSGSKLICDTLKDKLSVEPKTLYAASTLVKEYIEECVKHQESDADCANIGGHIHLGELTPTGFSWVSPPILG